MINIVKQADKCRDDRKQSRKLKQERRKLLLEGGGGHDRCGRADDASGGESAGLEGEGGMRCQLAVYFR